MQLGAVVVRIAAVDRRGRGGRAPGVVEVADVEARTAGGHCEVSGSAGPAEEVGVLGERIVAVGARPVTGAVAVVDRVLVAVRVDQRIEPVVVAVGLPQRELLAEGQRVAVVVDVRVAEQRVRIGTLLRVGQDGLCDLVLVVVEVARRLHLVAVRDAVAVRVGLATVGLVAQLVVVADQIAVVVGLGAVEDTVAITVAVGGRTRGRGGRRRQLGADERRARVLREPLTELLGQDAKTEAGRHRGADTRRERGLELGRDSQSQQLGRADVGLDEDRLAARALEHHRVPVAPALEVAAADLELLPDRDVHRRDASHDRGLGPSSSQKRRLGRRHPQSREP